jgi:bifunctional non-homologous end joining protein LigD
VVIDRGQARVFSRNGHDWSDRYPSIVRAAAKLRCQSAIIDGEAIVQNGDGASDFEALGSAMRRNPHSIILYGFDLLHLDGKDLRQQTLMERRASLKQLVGTDAQSRIQFSDEFNGDGDALFKACAERALEGIVSKHALSPYRSGRSRTWLKTKCFTESTFVVIGTDRDRKGALRALLTRNGSAGLTYAGAAFIALNRNERREFLAEVERLTASWGAFKSSRLSDAKWCHPKLVVRVKHLAGSKTLRHATVRGFGGITARAYPSGPFLWLRVFVGPIGLAITVAIVTIRPFRTVVDTIASCSTVIVRGASSVGLKNIPVR